MKRTRDESMGEDAYDTYDAVGMTPPPQGATRVVAPHAPYAALFASISPWKAPPPSRPHPSVKRCRDRSVPVDAMSRMMSAAVTNARIKKHSIGKLFPAVPKMACCAVCESAGEPMKLQVVPTAMHRCSHCERSMGDCCRRDCDACGSAFCSLCSTLNCDEQFDRVFCLACNQEQARA